MKTKEEVLEYINRNYKLGSGIFLNRSELKLLLEIIDGTKRK
jgi:hypothetical protein